MADLSYSNELTGKLRFTASPSHKSWRNDAAIGATWEELNYLRALRVTLLSFVTAAKTPKLLSGDRTLVYLKKCKPFHHERHKSACEIMHGRVRYFERHIYIYG